MINQTSLFTFQGMVEVSVISGCFLSGLKN